MLCFMRRWLGLGFVLASVALTSTSGAAGPKSAHHARGVSNVFWFMHLSDLHTSCEWNPTDEVKNIELALGPANKVIKPWFVIASGDLVDGSPYGVPTTGQAQAEWDKYKELYTKAGMTADYYFDMPGNHDGYGDIGLTHFLANSLQGPTNKSTYVSWVVDLPLGSYPFFGLNSAGNGSGPFTEKPEFLKPEIDKMKSELASNPAELVFVVAHHPITSPANSQQVIDFLKAESGGFYIHGHVHEYAEYTAGDPGIVVNQIGSLGQSGVDNVGVGVVDHNAFVYRATGTKKLWPHVVVTAPVSQTLRNGKPNPYAYAVCKDRVDNPVRALVFSDVAPSSVVVEVGAQPPVTMTPAGQPENMWVADVDTTKLPAGATDFKVTATVNGEPAAHTISSLLEDGPCSPLPIDPPIDAGTEGGTDGGASDAGDAGTPDGAAGTGGAGTGGVGASGGTASNTGGAAGEAPEAKPSESDDGGCGCRVPNSGPSTPLSSLALLGLALLAYRRRRSLE